MKESKKIVSILFSDVKDYSKIKDDHLYLKVSKFNEEFRKHYLNESNHFFCREIGDAFYICSYDPVDLLEIALNLRDKFINTHWVRNGFATDLKVRIALHTHKVIIKEEAGKVSDVIGNNITVAARIEPIVDVNQIYCSEDFYNNIKSEKDLKIKTISLGVKKLAKEFGEMSLYKIIRNSESDNKHYIQNEENNLTPIFQIPRIKTAPTQLETKKFSESSFKTIYNTFEKNIKSIKQSGVTPEINKVNDSKFTCIIYVQGKIKAECSIWFGNNTMHYDNTTIYFSYSSNNANNSYNESLYLKHNGFDFYYEALGMSLTQYNNKKEKTISDAIEFLWKLFISRLEN